MSCVFYNVPCLAHHFLRKSPVYSNLSPIPMTSSNVNPLCILTFPVYSVISPASMACLGRFLRTAPVYSMLSPTHGPGEGRESPVYSMNCPASMASSCVNLRCILRRGVGRDVNSLCILTVPPHFADNFRLQRPSLPWGGWWPPRFGVEGVRVGEYINKE